MNTTTVKKQLQYKKKVNEEHKITLKVIARKQ